jgi:hypothetical protein
MSPEALAALAVALGAGWASGLNAYAAVLVLGGAERLGLVSLPHSLQVLASPWVLGVAALLFALNFLADKIPYVDSINDVLQTFVRVPAGALLAYGAAGGLSPEVAVIAGLLGGTLAAGTHIAKTGSRDQHLARTVQQRGGLTDRGCRGGRRPDPGDHASHHVSVSAGGLYRPAGLVAAQAGAACPDSGTPDDQPLTRGLT